MKKSDQLKQQRKEKRDRLAEIQTTAKNEKREDYTADEATEIDGLLEEIRSLDTKIEDAEKTERRSLEIAAAVAGGGNAPDVSERDMKDLRNYSMLKTLRSVANPNYKLEGIELEMDQEARREAQSVGASPSTGALMLPMHVLRNLPMGAEKRDVSAEGGSGGSEGGVSVQTTVTSYIEALRNRTLLTRLGIPLVTGLSGNLKMPRENAVFAPSWEGESDDSAESSPTFTSVSMAPERLAGYVDITEQILLQNSSDMEMRIRNQILLGHALALDAAGFQGTGSNDQPTGILNDADINVVAIGTDGGALTDALIVEMEEKLDTANALFGNLHYVMTPKGRRTLKLLDVDSGSGLKVWDRISNQVNGYAGHSTNQLPSNLTKGSGTNLHALLFGEFSVNSAMFGMWGGLEILRDPYTQATKGIVRLHLNSYCDFAVLQPKKFCAIKDFDPTA